MAGNLWGVGGLRTRDNEQIRRDELTIEEVGNKHVGEEPPARDTTDSLSTGGLQGVHGVEQGSGDETARPNH